MCVYMCVCVCVCVFLIVLSHLLILLVLFIFFGHALMWNLSSLTRDGTHALCIGSTESHWTTRDVSGGSF